MSCCHVEPTATGEPAGPEPSADPGASWWRIGLGALVAGNVMVVDLALSVSEASALTRGLLHALALVAVSVVFVLLGGPLLEAVGRGLSRRRASFDLLFAAGIGGAFSASIVSMFQGGQAVYFEVAALLLVVYSLGQRLKQSSRRRGLEAARRFAPQGKTVEVQSCCGGRRVVPLDEVEVGQTVVVHPGRMIPVDGVVVEGLALVREAEMTGESFAAVRRVGDRVLAGTHPVDGTLHVRVEGAPGKRLIDEIIGAVEAAWQRPSRSQELAERWARRLLPVVLLASAVTFVVWALAEDASVGLLHAMAVLLIACPCALGFATPLAVWTTLGRWASRGLVARRSDAVERLAEIDTVVFDKTGTLTAADPRLVDIVTVADEVAGGPANEAGPAGISRRELLALVAAVEAASDHPLAAAFEGLAAVDAHTVVHELKLLPGRGIEATVRRGSGRLQRVRIGRTDLVDRSGEEALAALSRRLRASPDEAWPAAHRAAAHQLVVLVDGQPVALAAVDERPHPSLTLALRQLDRLGIETRVMTGDATERAERLPIALVEGELTPTDKQRAVRALEAAGRRVAFVGDGVNDAAAMAASTVGVSVALGADIAVETSDVAWHGRDLGAIAWAVETARAAVSVIRRNLAFAALYNTVGIGVAAAGLLHPVLAAVLMTSSSLLVTWRTTVALQDAGAPAASKGLGHDEGGVAKPLPVQ